MFLPCGNQLYGRSETGHFLTASWMSPHTSRGRLLRSQWMLTVVCETPISHGRESGKTQPFEAPAILDHRDRRGFVIFAAGDLVPGLASWNRARAFPGAFWSHSLCTLSPARSAIPMGSAGIRSPCSRRVMDHRGVADRCPHGEGLTRQSGAPADRSRRAGIGVLCGGCGMLNGAERRSARIGYQVQFAREESLGSMILTDIDKADTG